MKVYFLLGIFIQSSVSLANCQYEGTVFPEGSKLKMISNVKECQKGRWEKFKIKKDDEVCPLQENLYPENTIIKVNKDFRICKSQASGYDWVITKLQEGKN